MKLAKVAQDDLRLTFTLEDSNFGFANALRRSMMENVPTMAIESVEIKQNSSILYDEMLAQRLGLIPLTTDLAGYEMPSEDTAEENPAISTATLNLKTNAEGTITAKELQTNDPKIKPVQEDMPIVKLFKGQELDVVCYAKLGTGKQHMKWSPCLAWYRYKKNVSGVSAEEKKAIEFSPYHDMEPKGAKIEESEKDFVFFVEPWGQLEAKEIVTVALDQLEKELEVFAEALK